MKVPLIATAAALSIASASPRPPATYPDAPSYGVSIVCGHDFITDEALETPPVLVVHVTDMLGEPLAEAEVAIGVRRGADTRSCDTGSDGRCVFRECKAHAVNVTVELRGFAAATAKNVTLKVGCTSAMAVPLEVIDYMD